MGRINETDYNEYAKRTPVANESENADMKVQEVDE